MEWFEKIIFMLKCPKCSGDLEFKNQKITCKTCKSIFKIENNIPILLDE